MLSSTFVQMIESHSGVIAEGVLQRLRHDPKASHVISLPETELNDQCQEIVRNLGNWLTAAPETAIARRFEQIGRKRREEEVPLHESVHALHLVKDGMLEYIRNQGLAQTSVDLYAEEELEHQVGQFFDTVVYHVIRGYEGAGLPKWRMRA